MEEKKKDVWKTAWLAAALFLFLVVLEAGLIRIEGGERVLLLSPLLDFVRRVWDTFLEIFKV